MTPTRSDRAHHLLALAGYFLLTVLFTFPLILHVTTHVPGANKLDSYEYLWRLGHFRTALITGSDPWFVSTINYPAGYALAQGEITPFHTLLLFPLSALTSEIVTYNVSVFSSSVLTGWALYLWVRSWLRADAAPGDQRLMTLAAFFAGAVFAFGTWRMEKLTGHLNLFQMQWIILAIYGLERWTHTRRVRDALLWAGCAALAAWCSWYFALLFAIAAPIVLIQRQPLRLLRDGRIWRGLAAAGGLLGAALIPYLLLYVSNQALPDIPRDAAQFWSASPTDYLLPNPLHPIWGDAVERIAWGFPTPILSEFVMPIGFTVLLMALVGWRHAPRRWWAVKGVIAVGFVLSLGPILHIARLPLEGVPLPAALLRDLPVFSSMRTWARFALLVLFGVSLLAGVGLFYALRTARHARWIAVGTLCLALFELWRGPLGMVAVEPRPVDLWLAAQPDPAPIMEFPLSAALSGQGLLYTQYHQKPIIFGYGTFYEFQFRAQYPEFAAFPGDEAIDTLARLGVRYVLVTTSGLDYEPFTLESVQSQPRLVYVTTLGEVAVFAVR